MLLLVAFGALAGAAPAAATTFYVSTGGSDASNDCTNAAAPCLTIAHAVTSSESTPGAATIDVAPGTYTGAISLTNVSDVGMTIVGTGSGFGSTVIQGVAGAGSATIRFGTGNGLGALTLSNLTVLNPAGDNQSAVSGSGALTLNGAVADIAGPTTSSAAISTSIGPTTLSSSSATTSGTGRALSSSSGAVTLTNAGVSVTNASDGSPALVVQNGSAAISGSAISTTGSGGQAYQGQNASLTMTSTTVTASGHAGALSNSVGNVALTSDTISMPDSGDNAVAVSIQAGTLSMSATTISGAWTGSGLQTQAVGGTIVGSSISTADGGNSSVALQIQNAAPGTAMLVQRSVLSGSPGASPGTVSILDEDVVVDSSLVLGGMSGIAAQEQNGKSNTTTVVSSTIDGGVVGSGQQNGFASVTASANGVGDQQTVNVTGSILLQSPTATESNGGTSSVACAYTDVPSTVQGGSATVGGIACPSGSDGNVTSSPSSLFVSFGGNYQLLPTASAVDQVPESAVTPLPDGFAAASADVAGNPRVVSGTGSCTPVRDRGAYELPGHSGVVPAVTIGAPAAAGAGRIATFTATTPNAPSASLSWTFSDGTTATGNAVKHAFASAGSASVTVTATGSPASCVGSATASFPVIDAPRISPLKLAKTSFRAGRRARGTQITYTDDQAATTTFTVLVARSGRREGSACKAPSKANASHAACMLEVAIGRFTHHDVAGANHVTFRGVLHGHALAPGTYLLRAVPGSAGGAGKPATRSITIVK